ncbi:hypothetical protein [Infirmifilum sp. NZ]|uniref:hypothetical protein n=1 Tax=Infirmifilum sp. NZ TaxID=2926850 RepID=UPI00279ADC40|nr:hypothetical protein [Infirmifilum sp. NZ]UNQ73690.1 hypothetical protein MOV14_01425 [Infirmifilum sp. NZ]
MRPLLAIALLALLLASGYSLAQPSEARVLWRVTSAEGAAFSACFGRSLYVVGYTGAGSNLSGRIEVRDPLSGELVKSYSYRGASILYSCLYTGGRLFVAGVSPDGRWIVVSFSDDLTPLRSYTGVAGYATALASDGRYLYVAGIDSSTAGVRVEKRDLESLKLVAAYSPRVSNTGVYSCALGDGSLWLAGTALTPGGFTWRVEKIAANMSPLLGLRPGIAGYAFSVALSGEGLVYVTGPNGTIVLDSSGTVLAKSSVGGYKLAVVDGYIALYAESVKPLLYLLNSTTLDVAAILELSQNPAHPTLGSVAVNHSTVYIAAAEREQQEPRWSVYAIKLDLGRKNATLPSPPPSVNTTAPPQHQEQLPPLVVVLPEAVTSLALIIGLAVAVVALRREKGKRTRG